MCVRRTGGPTTSNSLRMRAGATETALDGDDRRGAGRPRSWSKLGQPARLCELTEAEGPAGPGPSMQRGQREVAMAAHLARSAALQGLR
jgi:hypothetical protein